MSNPLVSVIIPTLDRAALLQRAVNSVLAQTLGDWECIIVDDGSSDDTPAFLADLVTRDPRFRTHSMGRRSGNTLARSAACDMARGEFLAILDDDDWWEPGKLQAQVAAMQSAPQARWSYHAAQLVSPHGPGDIEHVQHGDDFLQRLVQYNWLRHSSMLFRRSAFEEVGGYDRRLPLASDWDLVLRMTLRFGAGAILTLPDPLVNYWLHPNNISTNSTVRTRAERRLVHRALIREGLLWKRPGLALRMLDRQLDREMHCALAEHRWVQASGAAVLSAVARPFRAWRWRRAASFSRSIFTRRRPAPVETSGTQDPASRPAVAPDSARAAAPNASVHALASPAFSPAVAPANGHNGARAAEPSHTHPVEMSAAR
jgi:GT2 family glycosyltransferase